MIPLKDYNPTRRVPVVTLVLIAANLAVFFLVQRPFDRGLEDAEFSYKTAAIPCEVVNRRPLTIDEVNLTFGDTNGDGRVDSAGDDTACNRDQESSGFGADDSRAAFPGKQVWLAVLYSMFLHGSFLHIAGNMLYLWIFGNNIEDHMGAVGYIAFYLASGLAATVAHVLVQPASTVPVVGASGAIAGVMGAYLVLFPNVQIRSLIIFFFILLRDISAKWLLGIWFVMQFFTNPAAGVAWVAHVGGFAFGALIALMFRERLRGSPEPVPRY